LGDILLSKAKRPAGDLGFLAFSIGAAILVVASNNVLIQRFLLVINKGFLGNLLLVIQSSIAITGLAIYKHAGEPNIILAVIIYLGPQIFTFIPVLIAFSFRLNRNRFKKSNTRLSEIANESLGFCGIGILSAVFLGSDYYFAAHYLDSSEIISYYLVTRIYFISFVVYYAYLLHRVRHLSILALKNNVNGVRSIIKDSMLVGFFCVVSVYLLALLLEQEGLFRLMTNGLGAGQILLFCGLIYFLARVCRDVAVVVVSGLNKKSLLYKIYSIEIFAALSLMYFITPKYGAIGIFISMMTACLLGFIYLLWYSKTKLLIHSL